MRSSSRQAMTALAMNAGLGAKLGELRINFPKVQGEYDGLLAGFLEFKKQSGCFTLRSNQSYALPLSLGQEWKYVRFSHSLTLRKCDSNSQAYRWEVWTKKIGEGGFSQVVECDGRVQVFNQSRALYKPYPPSKKRVIKFFAPSQHAGHLIKREFDLLKRAIYPRVKSPPNFSSANYLVMRKMEKLPFSNFLDKGGDVLKSEMANTLSLDDRLMIAIEMLYALKALHDQGIVHRDIKPDNIIIHLSGWWCRAKLIDLGLAKKNGEVDIESSGTPIYMSPECFEPLFPGNVINDSSDVFSLHWLICLLFGGMINQGKTMSGVIENTRNRDLNDLFHGMTDVSGRQKIAIRNLLTQMSQVLPEARMSLANLIDEFEQIRLEHQFASNVSSFEQIRQARFAAKKCIKELEYAEAHYRVERYRDFSFSKTMAKYLQDLEDKPEVIHTFAAHLRIDMLFTFTNKAEIQEKIASMLSHYSQLEKDLEAFSGLVDEDFGGDDIDDHQRESLMRLLYYRAEALSRYQAFPLSLGNMQALCEKLSKLGLRCLKGRQYIIEQKEHSPERAKKESLAEQGVSPVFFSSKPRVNTKKDGLEPTEREKVLDISGKK